MLGPCNHVYVYSCFGDAFVDCCRKKKNTPPKRQKQRKNNKAMGLDGKRRRRKEKVFRELYLNLQPESWMMLSSHSIRPSASRGSSFNVFLSRRTPHPAQPGATLWPLKAHPSLSYVLLVLERCALVLDICQHQEVQAESPHVLIISSINPACSVSH